jgi:hypothetical protein
MPELHSPGQGVPARAQTPTQLAAVAMPPPPPPDISGQNPIVTPPPVQVIAAPVPFSSKLALPLAVLAVAGVGFGIYAIRQQGAVQVLPTPPAAVTQAPVHPPAPAPAPVAAVPAPVQLPSNPVEPVAPSVSANTTLLKLTSTPSGAEVRDVDDRMLGTTPFEMRVPSNKQVQLTLKAEGYKPLVVKKVVAGETVALTGTLKRDPKAGAGPEPLLGGKRSGGYKDDPY